MNICDSPTPLNSMMPLEQAQEIMLSKIAPVTETQSVTLSHSLGRVLAEAVYSPLNIPPFTNSAMDGYALCAQDLTETTVLTCIGKSLAGAPFEQAVEPGQCVLITTGAQLPIGSDSVVMKELVSHVDDKIQINTAVSKGQCVRLRGEEFNTGELVLSAGELITARHIALLASLGLSEIVVYRPVKVAIFSTGDELIPQGQPLKTGQIYDSNRLALIALLQKMQLSVQDFGVISDDPLALIKAFEQANQQADVVISSGGVSVGEADYTKDILAKLGKIDFWKLAIKPGKPLAFGHLSDSVFFGLPGNPVSAMVTFEQLAKPALQKLGGQHIRPPLRHLATITNDLTKKAGRLEFQRGIASTTDQGELIVSSSGAQGSAMVSSMCKANCFIVLPREQANVASGSQVIIELFNND